MEQGMQTVLNGGSYDSNMSSQCGASSSSSNTQSNVEATLPHDRQSTGFEIHFAPGSINPNQLMRTPGRMPLSILAQQQSTSGSAPLNRYSLAAFIGQPRQPEQSRNMENNIGGFTSHALDASPFRPVATNNTLQDPGMPGMTSYIVDDDAEKRDSEIASTKQKSPSPRRKLKEKNRIAARKCREKKKKENFNLARKTAELERENEHLKAETRKLLEERNRLRHLLSLHGRCDPPELQQLIVAQITQPPPQNHVPAYAHISPSGCTVLWNHNHSNHVINYSQSQDMSHPSQPTFNPTQPVPSPQQAQQQFVMAQHGFVPRPQPAAPLNVQYQKTQVLPNAGLAVESPTDSAIEMDHERNASNQSAGGRMRQRGMTGRQYLKPLSELDSLHGVEETEDQEFAF